MQGFASVMQQATNQRLRILSPRNGTPLSQAAANSNSLLDIREQSPALVSSVDQGATLAPKAEVLSLTDGTVEERKPMSPLDAIRALEEKTDKEHVLKRPATNLTTPKPSKVTKKPAASKVKEVTLKVEKSSSGPWPPTMQRRLMLQPFGCSKCRNKPGCCDSCWKLRKKC